MTITEWPPPSTAATPSLAAHAQHRHAEDLRPTNLRFPDKQRFNPREEPRMPKLGFPRSFARYCTVKPRTLLLPAAVFTDTLLVLREAFAPTLNVAVMVDELATTTLLTVTPLP
jgi:hypothetical protein